MHPVIDKLSPLPTLPPSFAKAITTISSTLNPMPMMKSRPPTWWLQTSITCNPKLPWNKGLAISLTSFAGKVSATVFWESSMAATSRTCSAARTARNLTGCSSMSFLTMRNYTHSLTDSMPTWVKNSEHTKLSIPQEQRV